MKNPMKNAKMQRVGGRGRGPPPGMGLRVYVQTHRSGFLKDNLRVYTCIYTSQNVTTCNTIPNRGLTGGISRV